MAEKLREAAARGDVARVTRLLDENVKPLPDEVWLFNFLVLLKAYMRKTIRPLNFYMQYVI